MFFGQNFNFLLVNFDPENKSVFIITKTLLSL